MPSGGSLLKAHQGKEGPFISWLEDLGLKDFLGRYPLRQLVEWNWLVPKSRADYFFHWQGYALIDVICAADCIAPILNTPDVQDRALSIVRNAERVKECKPEIVLTLPNRWGGLSEPMTWLSHYRAFREAIYFRESEEDLRRKGAIELAAYLGINAEKLAQAIKEKFLVLAQDWIWANERHCVWTLRAFPYLQTDIYIAVEWLCYLSDKTFDYYLEAWQYEGFFGHRKWAELHKVLEYEFFTNRKYFLERAPRYFKTYNELLPTSEQLDGEHLKKSVSKLHAVNYPFGSFLGAFRQLHEELSYRSD